MDGGSATAILENVVFWDSVLFRTLVRDVFERTLAKLRKMQAAKKYRQKRCAISLQPHK